MQKVLKFGIVLFLSIFTHNLYAQIDSDIYQWKLRKEGKGVKVFTSKVSDSKYLAVSAVMTIDAKVDSITSMIMDLENCKRWAPQCAKAYIYESISKTQNYVYSLNNIPFPGRDRDAVSYVTWSKDSTTGVVSMISNAVSGKVPKVKGVIRIEKATAKWRFTPLENGQTLVESFAHVDPASDMPKWLLNSLLVGSPYKTMKRIRKRLKEGLYQNATIDF